MTSDENSFTQLGSAPRHTYRRNYPSVLIRASLGLTHADT